MRHRQDYVAACGMMRLMVSCKTPARLITAILGVIRAVICYHFLVVVDTTLATAFTATARAMADALAYFLPRPWITGFVFWPDWHLELLHPILIAVFFFAAVNGKPLAPEP